MFTKIELPHYSEKSFEDFMLKGIDFKTNSPIELHVDKRTLERKADKYYLEKGNEKYFYGFYETALKYYSYALKGNIQQIDAWMGQIRVLVDLGKTEAAIFWADKGLNQFPSSEDMELAKAYALANAGEIQKAKELVNKPIRKKESPLAWLFRGEILIKIKLRFLQKFIKPYLGIGKIGAFLCFVKSLEFNQKDAFINQRIGIAYLKSNNNSRAYEHLKTSLLAVPQNPLTLYCLAEYYNRIGNIQYALFHTKKAITFNQELDAAIELLVLLNTPYGKLMCKLRRSF